MKSTEDAWKDYVGVPLPGWGSKGATLFDCARCSLADAVAPADFACASIAFDGTASSRPGAKHGPAAIRKASLVYSSQTESRGEIRLRNMRTGFVHRPSGASIVDYGDLHVFESDPQRQVAATVAESYRVARMHRRCVFIGGEHMVSAATYEGVARAAKDTRSARVAYLQIDHHFDFGDHSLIHGRYYHGSNARRISELDLLPPRAMGFFGVGDFTSDKQFHFLREAGYPVVSTLDLLEKGNFNQSLHSVCDRLLTHADELYVSIDIDVCDSACAPGTGHVTVGGIGSRDFLGIAEVVKHYPVAALDLVEVSPDLDPTGATAHLAARFLFEYLCLSKGTKE